MTIPARTLKNLLRVAHEGVAAEQERLAAARRTRAMLAARLADECGLTHEEIARLLPGLSRQRAGQLVAQGRLALISAEGSDQSAASRSDPALATAEGTRPISAPTFQPPVYDFADAHRVVTSAELTPSLGR